jgi:hypothetical protein
MKPLDDVDAMINRIIIIIIIIMAVDSVHEVAFVQAFVNCGYVTYLI